jgi:hypothetical protein
MSDMLRPAVKARQTLTRLLVNVPAKLSGDNDFVPEWGDAFTENFFNFKRAVGFSGVEECDSFIKCPVEILIISGRQGADVSYLRLMFCTPRPMAETSSCPSLRLQGGVGRWWVCLDEST